ncbi:MAG: FAD:protein FMN transferase [Paracoccus sp. (in: a-proteobacteria)]|nr:FAD:protein FMN transferase [Paracoccus sp. (in: a-proteobacteria)]
MLDRRRFLTISAAALCAPPAMAQEWRGHALGADVTIRLAAPRAGRTLDKAARLLRGIERQFSLFTDSDLTRLNRDGRLTPTADFRALAQLADRVHRATGGAFDPGVQPLWQATRLGRPAPDTPGWAAMTLGREIRLRPGMALTFNGIAQGWAADRLAALMRDEGFSDVLIDAGEVVALGQRPTGGAWQAAIAPPEGREIRRLGLSDRALATSSPLGTRIGPSGAPHILHPHLSPRHALVSVSAESAALADALSTAFCLMEPRQIDAALRHFPGARVEAIL